MTARRERGGQQSLPATGPPRRRGWRLPLGSFARSFAALRIVEYRRWSAAQFLSGAGGAAAQVAMAWLVVELGGDGIALGAVAASMMLPTLVLGPLAGSLVDRFSRRAVLLVTAVAQMLIASALAVLTFTGTVQLWSLLALSLLHGIAFAADNPARQLLVLDIVGRDEVTSAVGMNEVAINGSRVLGPAIAGLLLVFGGTGWCFVFNALAFVLPIIVLLTLRIPASHPSGAHPGAPLDLPRAGALTDTRSRNPLSPWRFTASHRRVRSTLLLAVCAAACYNIAVVMPLVVVDVFEAGGGTYGALAMAFGLGALPGALLSGTGPVAPRSGEIRVLALVMGVSVLLTAAAPTLPLLFSGMVLVGATAMWFIARANAFVMLQTPAAIRGRVMGIWAMALPGSSVVTGLATGALADAVDPRVAYATVGAVTALAALGMWRGLRTQD